MTTHRRAAILLDERELLAIMEAAALYAQEHPEDEDAAHPYERSNRRYLDRVIQKCRSRGLNAVRHR